MNSINSKTDFNKSPLLKECSSEANKAPEVDSLQAYLGFFIDKKSKAEECSYFLKFLTPKQQEAVQNCGVRLEVDTWKQNKDGKKVHTLHRAFFCKHRFCPVCAALKAIKVGDEFIERVKWLRNEEYKKLSPKEKWILRQNWEKHQRAGCWRDEFKYEPDESVAYISLTLTVPNPEMKLTKKTLKRMSAAWQRFSKFERFQNAVLTYIRGVELLGEPENYKPGYSHPHFHCLLVVPYKYFKSEDYIPQWEWQQMWMKAWGTDQTLQVHVERAWPKAGTKGTALIANVAEVVKYSIKLQTLSHLTEEDVQELLIQSKGIRQFNIGGKCRKEYKEFMEAHPDYNPDQAGLYTDKEVKPTPKTHPELFTWYGLRFCIWNASRKTYLTLKDIEDKNIIDYSAEELAHLKASELRANQYRWAQQPVWKTWGQPELKVDPLQDLDMFIAEAELDEILPFED